MAADQVYGNVDRFFVDPLTSAAIFAGWVADAADLGNRALVVQFIEDGLVIGQTVADLPRGDNFHGFAARCDGPGLPARAASGRITAIVLAQDGRRADLHWHEPFVAGLLGDMRKSDRAAIGMVSSATPLLDGIEIRAGAVFLRIVAVRDDIIRVRLAPAPHWVEDLSWAVLDSARHAAVPVRQVQEPDAVGFATKRLIVRVLRDSGRLLITRSDGVPVCSGAEDLPAAMEGGGFTIHKQCLPHEQFFGLGDQPGRLDRRGRAFTLWNTDANCFQEGDGPLYKSIPFYMAVRHGGSTGILLDNSWRSHFDFDAARRDVVSFGAEGGAADYYVIAGADAKAVLGGYAHLTGLPPLPPLWAFGFQQSRYSYMSQDAVLAVADGLRRRRFPADVIYCDIDYQDRYRPFTVNPATFPDLPGMVRTLAVQGFKTVLITDLHIAVAEDGYAPYREGIEGDHFVRDAAGATYAGESWPGAAHFPDFTRDGTRAWWGSLYRAFAEGGVAGFWNDMNEPAVANGPGGTMPLDVVHRIAASGYPYRSATHAELHNVVGHQNARATYDGLLALRPDERPFVLTRASFAGGQRYGWSWTGDNSATWTHLRLTTPMLVNAGLSGLAFIGADVGGFFGDPPPDLLTRWFQVAAFHPLFRSHCFQESAPREPWLDGPAHEAIRRRFVEARYQLLPYIYTVAEEATRTGLPMLRPLFLECPSAVGLGRQFNREPHSQFMLGAALMIAPPLFAEMRSPYDAILPDGPWYEYWTGRRIDAPAVALRLALEDLPVFVRAGSILPRHAVVQSTSEMPEGPLELQVYPGRPCAGEIYADDGHSFGFQRGAFLRQHFRFAEGQDGVEFHISAREGGFAPWWQMLEVTIHGLPDRAYDVSTGQITVHAVGYDQNRQALRVVVAASAQADVIRIKPQG